MKRRIWTVPAALAATIGLAGTALASSHILYEQDFDNDVSGWLDSDDAWYGTVTHNASGGTATFQGDGGDGGDGSRGPFSRFDGYRSAWPGDYIAELDVYLDPAWAASEGFDYSVAASKPDGSHLRDFIFHVGVVENYGPITESALLVNGSNNADFTTNRYKLVNENGGAYHVVAEAGWYTFQHVFRDENGVLAVDLNLLDADGDVLWTATRTNAADMIGAEVGGNRYASFTHIDVVGGIEVDNQSLYLVVDLPPAPESMDDCKKGGFAAFGFENQGQCVASVAANENAGK